MDNYSLLLITIFIICGILGAVMSEKRDRNKIGGGGILVWKTIDKLEQVKDYTNLIVKCSDGTYLIGIRQQNKVRIPVGPDIQNATHIAILNPSDTEIIDQIDTTTLPLLGYDHDGFLQVMNSERALQHTCSSVIGHIIGPKTYPESFMGKLEPEFAKEKRDRLDIILCQLTSNKVNCGNLEEKILLKLKELHKLDHISEGELNTYIYNFVISCAYCFCFEKESLEEELNNGTI